MRAFLTMLMAGALLAGAPTRALASSTQLVGDADAAAEAAADAAASAQRLPPTNLDLDERIRPVSGQLFLKGGRHELSPTVGLSLGDAFFSKYVFGLEYAYHLSDSWMMGLNVSYALSSPSGAVNRCDSGGQGCRLPSKDDLVRAPGDFGMMAGIDVSWAPLYGKISVLAERVLHFDTYVLAGGGVLQTRMAPPGSSVLEERFTPAVHLAIGQRYVLSRYSALRFEVRDVLYQAELEGKSGVEKRVQNQLLFTLGLSFFLGGE